MLSMAVTIYIHPFPLTCNSFYLVTAIEIDRGSVSLCGCFLTLAAMTPSHWSIMGQFCQVNKHLVTCPSMRVNELYQ